MHDDHTPVAVSSVGLTALVRLAELSEWVDVMDAALEYRRRQFGARQKRSVLSSLEQKGGGVSEVLKVLTLEDTRHLMVVYLNKVSSTARATQIVDGSSHVSHKRETNSPVMVVAVRLLTHLGNSTSFGW